MEIENADLGNDVMLYTVLDKPPGVLVIVLKVIICR
jgi:hypothetical protein